MSRLFQDLMEGMDSVEEYLKGKREGYKVHVPAEVDVARIRKELKMTQAAFSGAFGFSLDAVKHWEGGRRTPEAAARAFLMVISKNPGAVLEALRSEDGAGAKRKRQPLSRVSSARRRATVPRKRVAA